MMTLAEQLAALAQRYETPSFLQGDPSQFMHGYSDKKDCERAAFVAAALSYGRRDQFIPKVAALLEMYIARGAYPPDDDTTYYRLHTNAMVRALLMSLDDIYGRFATMEQWLRAHAVHTALDALHLITSSFARYPTGGLVPNSTRSACKRLCLFLRWMVRDASPVDLGLWAGTIDKRSLIIPLDTHVLHTARALGLIKTSAATMTTALALTEKLRAIFPGDPLRGDFALFGAGVEGQDVALNTTNTIL